MEEFKKIVALSFIKAYNKNPLANSKTALAKIISEEINNNENGSLLEEHRYAKTVLNYYNYFFHSGKKQKPSKVFIDKLLNYLNYDSIDQFIKNQLIDEDYLDKVPFVKDLTETKLDQETEPESGFQDPKGDIDNLPPEEIKEDGNSNSVRKIIITLSITLPILAIAYLGYNWQKKECMIWSEDHYERAACNLNGIGISHNQDWVDNFIKVKNDTISDFFKEGKPLYWYYRKNKKIELFTKSGMHPTENVKLKPITETIVRNYILKE